MSALLPHIRSHRAMAEALAYEANESRDPPASRVALLLSRAHSRAADHLQQQMEAQCTGETAPITPPRRKA
jgi:hypothetical protein